MATKTAHKDVYQTITDQIISAMEAGTAPWHKPWDPSLGIPRSLSTLKPYKGINIFWLSFLTHLQGYTSPWWGTYDQIAERSGMEKVIMGKRSFWKSPDGESRGIRKGEKATTVLLWKPLTKKDPQTGEEKQSFFAFSFPVFNADQADNLVVPELTQGNDNYQLQSCEDILAGYKGKPSITHGDHRAYFIPSLDEIHLPDMKAFDSSEEYYSTLFHECVHSTGHESRLNRKEINTFSHFGDTEYSKEELVAEMGSAMLSGIAGISASTIENSAAYLAGWLKALKSDKRLVVHAAAQSQKAADHILGIAPATTKDAKVTQETKDEALADA